MKVVRPDGIGQPLFVLPDDGRVPLAGPFPTAMAARVWVIEKVEAGLSPAKLEVWRQVSLRLPSPTDMGLELALVALVARGRTVPLLTKYLLPPRVDRKMLAAGGA